MPDAHTAETNSTVTEAPRPVRDRTDGRSPGLRVGALCRLPEPYLRGGSVAFGQALAAYSCGGSRGFGSPGANGLAPTTFPHRSLSRERPSIRGSTTSRRGVVNGRRLLPPPRCLTLAALSGARHQLVTKCVGWNGKPVRATALFRHCPRNG